jgi:hypothetical protein
MGKQKRRTSADFKLMMEAVNIVSNRHEEVSTNLIMDEVLDEYYRLLCVETRKAAAIRHVAKYRSNTLAMSQFISKGLRIQGNWVSKVDKGSRQLIWSKVK